MRARVRNTTVSPHGLRALDDQLARARTVLEHPRSRATARIGLVEVPLTVVTVASGRIVASAGRGWQWPNDEPDAAGEVAVRTDGDLDLEVRVVGWWSPLAADTVWLDAVEALIIDDSARVHLDRSEYVDWFLR